MKYFLTTLLLLQLSAAGLLAQQDLTPKLIQRLKSGHDEMLQNFGYRAIIPKDHFQVIAAHFVSIRYGRQQASFFLLHGRSKILVHVLGDFGVDQGDHQEIRFILTLKIVQAQQARTIQFTVNYKTQRAVVALEFTLNKESTDRGRGWLACYECLQAHVDGAAFADIAQRCRGNVDCWVRQAGSIGIKMALRCLAACS